MNTLARLTLFSYGFRPFFLAAGLFGLLVVPAWLWLYATGGSPVEGLPAMLWHGHEMLFGFIAAAIAGFLLTAVPSWTGCRGFGGRPLVLLAAAWLAGRLAMALGTHLPLPLVALAELAFLPGLAALIAPPILREKNRNLPMLAVLAALWLADAVYLYALATVDAALASRMLGVALAVVLLLITIIGGRIVPSFTGNALRRVDQSFTITSRTWLERALPAGMALNVILEAVPGLASPASGALAAVLAALHALRLSGWRSLRVRGEPILWVLHVAYAWLPLGFALKASLLLAGAPLGRFWLHAFGIGAAATMIVAVMSRAALGHTGRPLVVARSITLAYGLLTLGALARVFGPALYDGSYVGVLLFSGLCWSAAFALFVVVYLPILTGPRLDGRGG